MDKIQYNENETSKQRVLCTVGSLIQHIRAQDNENVEWEYTKVVGIVQFKFNQ